MFVRMVGIVKRERTKNKEREKKRENRKRGR
jgi:hypothetical protein